MNPARDDYPNVLGAGDQARVEQYEGMCKEIDRLRVELERCERLNERLRKACDDATNENIGYRNTLRHWTRSTR